MPAKVNYAKLYTLRKDGRYQGYYYDARGIRHAVIDRDPERLHEKLDVLTSPPPRLFSDACSDWETVHRPQVTERTWANYAPHLSQLTELYGNLQIQRVAAQLISSDLERMKARGYSRTVVNTRRVIWSGVLRNEVLLGNLQFNPASSIHLPKNLPSSIRTAPTDDEIRIILSSVDAPFGFFPFFLLCTGMRKSEALALSWNDVDLDNRVIHVVKSLEYIGTFPRVKLPKTKAGIRSVPIIDILFSELLRRRSSRLNDLLFPAPKSNRNSGGGFMTERAYDVAWSAYCSAVSITGLTAHNLRHGTATLLIESGVDPETAQHILGHSRISTTLDLYVELRARHLAENVHKFSEKMSNLMSD